MTNIRSMSRFRRVAGFSAIELIMTTGLMSLLASMAAIQVGKARPALKGDGAMRVVMAQVNMARELAITPRRFMQLTFTGTNVVNTIRQDIPAGTTTLSSVPIEGGIQFSLMSSVSDTPDAFGNSSPVTFGVATAIRFSSDGSLAARPTFCACSRRTPAADRRWTIAARSRRSSSAGRAPGSTRAPARSMASRRATSSSTSISSTRRSCSRSRRCSATSTRSASRRS